MVDKSFIEALRQVYNREVEEIDEAAPNPADKPVKNVTTKGGNYPVYRKPTQTAQSFRDAFSSARKRGDATFKWKAADGIERSYGTALKGETPKKVDNVPLPPKRPTEIDKKPPGNQYRSGPAKPQVVTKPEQGGIDVARGDVGGVVPKNPNDKNQVKKANEIDTATQKRLDGKETLAQQVTQGTASPTPRNMATGIKGTEADLARPVRPESEIGAFHPDALARERQKNLEKNAEAAKGLNKPAPAASSSTDSAPTETPAPAPESPQARRRKTIQSIGANESTNPLIAAFLRLNETKSSNMFVEAKKQKKHLDPVGKEDEDIDNDGDKDKSDEYLHNRRKAISKAMKEEVEELDEMRSALLPQDHADAKKMTPEEIKARHKEYLDVAKRTSASGTGGSAALAAAAKMAAAEWKNRYMKEEVDTGESDARKSTPSSKEKNDEVFAKHRKRVKEIVKEEGEETREGGAVVDTKTGKKVVSPTAHRGDDEGGKYSKSDRDAMNKKAKEAANEEVEFSETELAHIAAILEANPVAPTPDDYSGSKNGVSKRDLTDETIVETKKKDPSELKQRGRKAGVKVGAYKNKAVAAAGGESESEAAAEPKNLVAQNPRTRIENGRNVVDVEHPSQAGVKRTMPAKEYNDFRSAYLNADKPATKEKMHDSMVAKVFGR